MNGETEWSKEKLDDMKNAVVGVQDLSTDICFVALGGISEDVVLTAARYIGLMQSLRSPTSFWGPQKLAAEF